MAATALDDARPSTFRRGAAMLRAELSLHPRTFAIAVGGAAVFAVATIASSFAVRFITDEVIVPRFEQGSVAWATVAVGVTAIVLIGLVRAAGVIVRRTWAGKTTHRVAGTLRERVMDRYQAQPLAWHLGHGTGELAAHAGVDVDAATDILGPLPYSTAVVIMVVLSTAWLLATDPVLGGVAVVLFPVLAGLNIVYQRAVDAPATAAQHRIGEVSSIVHESLDGVTVVKALGAEAHESARLDAKAAELRDAKVHVATLRATFEAMLDGMPALANVLLVYVGAVRVSQGAATVGDVTSVVYLFTLLVWPLRIIGFALGDLPHALAGWSRVEAVLAEPLLPQPRASMGSPAEGTAVSLRGVRFAYADGRSALQGVDLDIAVGRTVAVVGPTGSGKTTLLQVMDGLLGPDEGEVHVQTGGRALVFQESFLFAETLRENVLLGLSVSDEQLHRALALAQAESFLDELPAGIDTVVGERGVSLSGGQRQRIALARALVRSPRLLLLDDATSSLDPTTEARILGALHGELAGMTCVMVATRPSTIALADEVVYVSGGLVAGRGTHAELLVALPAYRHLVEAYERDRRSA